MFRELPRSGMKVTLTDFEQGLKYMWQNGDGAFAFENKFKDWLDVNYAFGVSSGSVALYLILKVLRTESDKDEVIIPAFICPTVPLAIARAELKVKVCDISRDTFDFDYHRLQEMINNKTLCVIAAYLSGFPPDLDSLLKVIESKNTLLIEDCAQAMGAEYKSRKVGQFGSFGFFSLGRGKGLTTYNGGIIVTNNEHYTRLIKSLLSDLAPRGGISNLWDISKLLGYLILFRPRLFFYIKQLTRLYWRSRNLPLHAENEYHRMDFDVSGMSDFKKALAYSLLDRLEETIKEQRKKGKYLMDGLKGLKDLAVLREIDASASTYLLLPVIFKDSSRCEKIYRILRKESLGVSKLYTRAINQYEYLRDIIPSGSFPNAESIAKRTLTLPTHCYVTQSDMDKTINIIREAI